MVDWKAKAPHKFDELTQSFVRVGTRQANRIFAGLEGHAVIIGLDSTMYGWVETEQKWKSLDKSSLYWMGIGEKGRLFKIAK